MQRPRFKFELEHYTGKFFHDLVWLPVEICRAVTALLSFGCEVFFYRVRKLGGCRPSSAD